MVRRLTEFMSSGVRKRAATLEVAARISYLRNIGILFGFWAGLSSLLAAIAVGLSILSWTLISHSLSATTIGYLAFYVVSIAAWVVLACSCFGASRFAFNEAKQTA